MMPATPRRSTAARWAALLAAAVLATAGFAWATDARSTQAAAVAQRDLDRVTAGITAWPLGGREATAALDTTVTTDGHSTRVQVRRVRAEAAGQPALFAVTAQGSDGGRAAIVASLGARGLQAVPGTGFDAAALP